MQQATRPSEPSRRWPLVLPGVLSLRSWSLTAAGVLQAPQPLLPGAVPLLRGAPALGHQPTAYNIIDHVTLHRPLVLNLILRF